MTSLFSIYPTSLYIAEELMQSAVGKKPLRLAKTEPFIQCDACGLVLLLLLFFLCTITGFI